MGRLRHGTVLVEGIHLGEGIVHIIGDAGGEMGTEQLMLRISSDMVNSKGLTHPVSRSQEELRALEARDYLVMFDHSAVLTCKGRTEAYPRTVEIVASYNKKHLRCEVGSPAYGSTPHGSVPLIRSKKG